ncbi:MAG: serine/threonine-protein kinase, partial [Planctomycetota bacterium]
MNGHFFMENKRMIAQKQHIPQHCLPEAEVREFLAGRMPSERFDMVLSHMESCDSCRQRAEMLSDPSGEGSKFSFSWLRREATSEPFLGELECVAAVNELLSQVPSAKFASETSAQGKEAPLPFSNLGGYRIVQAVGSGGMGTVFLAEHERLKKKVAIKILTGDKAHRAGWLDRFNREMTSVAALEHVNIVRALDAGEQNGVHYLVMEFLDGFDLSRVARNAGEMSVASACEIVRQAALGLHAIHLAGMVHRDVKPSNLFLTQQGTIKLLDLGLVLDGESPVAGDERLTTVGYLMGTLPYMSREQINDSSQVDFRADLYSLGATLFRLIAGRVPMGSSADLPGTVRRITQDDCPSLNRFRAELPEELVELVAQLLDHDPSNRPHSAMEVADRLAAFTDGADLSSLVKLTHRGLNEVASGSVHSLSPASADRKMPALQSERRESNSVPPSRPTWQRMLLFAAFPFLLLCGVLLTLATDRGTLVIETKLDDVGVEIKQNEEVVESLRVSSASPERVQLWSGSYTIEIVGEGLGRLEIDRGEVAVFRGEQVAVTVREQISSKTASSPGLGNPMLAGSEGDNGQIYQGKSFNHWLGVLSREQDLETLFEAIEAVLLLADTPAKQESAAREMLRPARRLGGVVWGQPSQTNAKSQLERSQWYMGSVKEWFSRFPAAVRIKVIAEQLPRGNERTAMACMLLLNDLSIEEVREANEDESKRDSLKKLNSMLSEIHKDYRELTTKRLGDDLARDLETTSVTALEVKIKINIAMNGGYQELSRDAQIVRSSTESYEKAKEEMDTWVAIHRSTEDTGIAVVNPMASLTHMSGFNAVVMANSLDEKTLVDPRPVLLGMHTHFQRFVTPVEDDDLKDAFWPYLSYNDGKPLAEATEYYLRSMANHPKQFGGGPELNPVIGRLAIKNLENHPKPHVALLTLARLKTTLQKPDRNGIIKQPL